MICKLLSAQSTFKRDEHTDRVLLSRTFKHQTAPKTVNQ